MYACCVVLSVIYGSKCLAVHYIEIQMKYQLTKLYGGSIGVCGSGD